MVQGGPTADDPFAPIEDAPNFLPRSLSNALNMVTLSSAVGISMAVGGAQVSEMAKGGKQNIQNEITRELISSKCPNPCEVLKEQYKNASNSETRLKIKQAMKYFNCDNKNRFGKK